MIAPTAGSKRPEYVDVLIVGAGISGIRSDSDLHTFGYEFKPWRDEDAIATADRILAYLRESRHGERY